MAEYIAETPAEYLAEANRRVDEAIADAIRAERRRCVGILNRAREGEIDGDLRSLISRIENPRGSR